MAFCTKCNRNVVVIASQDEISIRSQAAVTQAKQHFLGMKKPKITHVLEYDKLSKPEQLDYPSCDLIAFGKKLKWFVEVKSTSTGVWHLTDNEMNGLRQFGKDYWVFVVFKDQPPHIFRGEELLPLRSSVMFSLSKLHLLRQELIWE